MKTIHIAALITAAFAVTACGRSPVSASVESSVSGGSDSRSVIDRAKDLSTSLSSRASVQMPASGLIVQALREAMPVLYQTPPEEFRTMVFSAMQAKDFVSPDTIVSVITDAAKAELVKTDFKPLMPDFDAAIVREDISQATREAFIAKRICAAAMAEGKSEQGMACYTDFLLHAYVALSISAAHAGRSGWEIDVIGGFDNKPASPKLKAAYLDGNAFPAELASIVEGELAAKLSNSVMRDPEDAKAQIIKAFLAMPAAKLQGAIDMAWREVKAGRESGRTLNTSGQSRGIEWTTNSGTNYLGTQTGWTITRNGTTWFGDGAVDGKKYDISMESSISTSMTKRQSTTDSASTGANTTGRASATTN